MSAVAVKQQASLPISEASPEVKARLQGIDGLRAVAALLVVWHHCWLMTWPAIYKRSPEGLTLTLTGWMGFGHFAVVAFIAISGFCLGLPIANKGRKGWPGVFEFYKRRALRIIPPYYISMAFTLFLIAALIGDDTGTHWDPTVPVDYSKIWRHLLLINNFFGSWEINGVYWSIAVEWQIYLLFPIIAMVWMRWNPWLAALLSFAIAYGVFFKLKGTPYQGASSFLLAAFSIGFLTAHAHARLGERLNKPLTAGALLLLLGGIVAFCSQKSTPQMWYFYPYIDVPVAIATGLIMLLAVRQGTGLNKVLEWRALRSMGAYSYSLYLVHMPLLQVVWLLAIIPLGYTDEAALLVITVLGTAVSIAAAYGFYLLVERHFVRSHEKVTKLKS